MKEKKLDKGILKAWLLTGALIFIGIIILTVIFIVIAIGVEGLLTPAIITDIIVLLIGAAFCFIYPILRHKYYTYYYDEKRIVVKRGIIFKKEIIIPVCQIQDLHIEEGPFDLLFKVAKVEVSTAGSNYKIVGIKKDLANTMIKELENSLYNRLEEINND